jgi:type IV pilus assembly protein PilW
MIAPKDRAVLSRPSHGQLGFSLVELMVGIVIALMASLAIFQTFAASEEQRRTTGSGSEGLQSGTLAMAQVQALVRNAGYNLVTPTSPAISPPNRGVAMGVGVTISNSVPVTTEFLMGCRILDTQLPSATGSTRVAPVFVRAGAGALDSDVITLMEGSSSNSPMPSMLESAHPAGSTVLTLTTIYGYQVNDWVIVYEQSDDTVLNANPGTNRNVSCTLTRVTAVSANLAPAGVINVSVGTSAPYSGLARVVNLGQTPLFQELRVDTVARRLTLRNLRTNAVQILADDVVTMKVQTGLDITADDLIDQWTNPPALDSDWANPNAVPTVPSIASLPVATGPRSLNQIKALRIGLLLRSPQFERPNATTGQCNSTGTGPFNILPAVPGAAANRVPDMPASPAYSLTGNERCYRYNTVSAIVPLRNIIMSDL